MEFKLTVLLLENRHKARETQRFLQEKVPSFISSQWPPYSPDLNPMDLSIWSILEAKVSTKKYQMVNALEFAFHKIPSDHIRATCEAFDAIIRIKGGYIEI